MRRLLGVAVVGFGLVMGLLWLWLRQYRLPVPTGGYAVGTTVLDMTDGSRPADGEHASAARRQLVVQLWYPADGSDHEPAAAYRRWRETAWLDAYKAWIPTNSRWNAALAPATGAFPVLIFNPRWGGERTQNTDLAEELASHGFVVASVDHPYNASRVLLGDGTVVSANLPLEGPKGFAASAAERISYWDENLAVWTADDRFVLDELDRLNRGQGNRWYGRLDMGRVGAFGHSFGGAASLALCGLDERVKAAVNLDGWTFGGLSRRTAAQAVLMMYEDVPPTVVTDAETRIERELDDADAAVLDASSRQFGGYRFYVTGAQHLDFTDQPLLPPLHLGHFTGPINPLEMQGLSRAYVLAFFDESLRGRRSDLLAGKTAPFTEVRGQRRTQSAK